MNPVGILRIVLCVTLGMLARVAFADPPIAVAPTKAVERLVLIVHPCPYEIYHQPQPDSPLYPYRALEEIVFGRWLAEVATLPPSAFVVQIDMPKTAAGPDQLHAACVRKLGASRVCRIAGEYQYPEKPEPLRDYYTRIHKRITEQLAQHGLVLDPAECKAELWGQSFEGCAPGYASAVCRRLGLRQVFAFDYRNSVPDAPFLLDSLRFEIVELPDSDVVAYLFELKDGTSAALFQARKHEQWLDRRPIELQLDSALFWISDKSGKTTIWPAGTEAAGVQLVRLTTSEERFVRTRTTNGNGLKEVVGQARVGTAPIN